MSGILSKIFSKQAGSLVDSVGGVLDNVITNDAERLKAKQELTEIVLTSLNKLGEQQKEVLLAELGGNKLQRNWRPLLMISFGAIVVSTFFILPLVNIFLNNPDITEFVIGFGSQDNFWELLKLGMGGYVIGRTAEKITDNVTKNVDMTFLKKKDREVK